MDRKINPKQKPKTSHFFLIYFFIQFASQCQHPPPSSPSCSTSPFSPLLFSSENREAPLGYHPTLAYQVTTEIWASSSTEDRRVNGVWGTEPRGTQKNPCQPLLQLLGTLIKSKYMWGRGAQCSSCLLFG